VIPVRGLTRLDSFDAVLLPGTKNAGASLRFLRDSSLADELVRVSRKGKPVVGICGGMQLLGHGIHDPSHLEGGDVECLGLLDATTTLETDKTTCQRRVGWVHGGIVEGYEIHHGRTRTGPLARPHLEEELGWEQGSVCGVYLHGLFENTEYRAQFLRSLGWEGEAEEWRKRLDLEIERVATLVMTSGWSSKLETGRY
jgi:adenosylcobyric acid synthase